MLEAITFPSLPTSAHLVAAVPDGPAGPVGTLGAGRPGRSGSARGAAWAARKLAAAKSTLSSERSFTFGDVTAFVFSCGVPTLFAGRLVAA